MDRDNCLILFSLLQDFHASVSLNFAPFSMMSIHSLKYLKLSTFLMFSLLTYFKTVFGPWLKIMNSALSAFRCKPVFSALCWTWCKKSCACTIFSVTNALSSDWWLYLDCVFGFFYDLIWSLYPEHHFQ